VLATFEPDASFNEVLARKGRDFGWVISGELVLLYGDREYILEERQFVEYDASRPPALRNDREQPAEMIAFMNSPYW
jgi:hypothetical protein